MIDEMKSPKNFLDVGEFIFNTAINFKEAVQIHPTFFVTFGNIVKFSFDFNTKVK